jgi:Phasin protein
MAQNQGRIVEESKELPIANFIPTEFVELGKKRVEVLMKLQTDLIDAIQEINQAWLARARTEATLNTELVSKLSSARTVPEQADAYQQAVGKRMEMLVEDSRRLLSDSQKFVSLGTRFLSNGAGTNGSGA